MNAWRLILATIVIFGAGVVTGGLVVGHYGRANSQAAQHPPGPARPGQRISAGVMRIEFLRRIERDLNLSPQQKERIDAIISEGQERTRQIMEPLAPEIRQQLNTTLENFRAVLSPVQQGRFDELIKQAQHPRDTHRSDKRDRFPEGSETPKQ